MSNLGYGFEIETLNFFRSLEKVDTSLTPIPYKSYRVQGSGADKNSPYSAKNILDIGMEGDVIAELDYLDKKVQIECKHYASETPASDKSLRVSKKWLDQNKTEAEYPDENGETRYSMVAIKFKDTSDVHYILPKEHLKNLLLYISLIKESKNVSLKDFSSEEIFEELKKRSK